MPVNATISAPYIQFDARPLQHLQASRYKRLQSEF
jgi:hypothetical protein